MNTLDTEGADRLAADGFVLLPGVCSAEQIETMLSVCRERMLLIKEKLGTREIGIGSVAGYEEIVQRSPGRWDVPISPQLFGFDEHQMPWWPLIAAVLGEDAEHLFSGVVSADPGSPAQYWHTDSPHEGPDHRPAHAINVLIALHDVPLEMGPTECARGSHVLTNHLVNTALVKEELLYQHEHTSPETLVQGTNHAVPENCTSALTAGTCLVFDDRLMHRGMANNTNNTRHVAYFSYCSRGYATNTHFESQRSLLKE